MQLAPLDPISFEIVKNSLISAAEEMGIVLRKSSFSPNIKERRDFSCALFDSVGNLVAQAEHIPVHLGAMPHSVRTVLVEFGEDIAEGDSIILNDPFRGGTHLPDITIVSPIFRNGKLVASFPVEHSDQIMLVTDKGQLIRCPVEDIRIAGRSTQGVIVFDTAEDEHVVSVEHIGDDGENGENGNGG